MVEIEGNRWNAERGENAMNKERFMVPCRN